MHNPNQIIFVLFSSKKQEFLPCFGNVWHLCSLSHTWVPSIPLALFRPSFGPSHLGHAQHLCVGLFDVLDETTDFLSLDGRYKSDGTTPELMHQNLCE